MAYLAQPIIVNSPIVVDADAHTSTMNLAGNIVRSSHYIPDPSSTSSVSIDALHPTLKSLPYPLALPPVMSPITTMSGADLANFEEDEEDADTEDSRSLLSAVESINDTGSFITSSTSFNAVGSFRDNVLQGGGGGGSGSFRAQSTIVPSTANVRSQSRSPVAYHRIPVGTAHTTYPIIPTVPSAAVAAVGSHYGTSSSSPVAGRVPGSRVKDVMPRLNTVVEGAVAGEGAAAAAEEPTKCNVCNDTLSNSSPLSPTTPSTKSNTILTNTCPGAHTYHTTCFQTVLLQPAIARTELPSCPAPCNQHVPAHCFLQGVSSEMKRRYLQVEMEIMLTMDDGEARD